MSAEKYTSKKEDLEKRSEIIAGIPSECLEDPQFIKVLATSLLSEIVEFELILKETDEEIKGLKGTVTKGLEKRKSLKQSSQEFSKKKIVLSTALESLEREVKHRSIEVETVKNRLDDVTLREITDRAKFKKILDDYQESWQKYKEAYEERPPAKERQIACKTLKQLRRQLMKADYEKEFLITMLKQRKTIDSIRVRASVVEISAMMIQRWKDQSHIHNLNTVSKQLQDKLDTYTSQLLQLEQEEKKKQRAEIEASMMPPPRLDFSFMRSICNESGHFFKRKYQLITPARDLDSVSINTLMLEEMCKTTTNDEVPEISRKRIQGVDEDGEYSLNIPTSVSMIEEHEPIYPPVSESITNQSNIQNKLRKLHLEKKTDFALEKQQQRHPESNTNSKDNGSNYGYENEVNDYEGDAEESHQRTRRWCEESQKKYAPFLLTQRSNSLNERTKDASAKEDYKSVGQKFAKASSIHGSETRSLRQAQKKNKGVSIEIADEPSRAMDLNNVGNKQNQRNHPSGGKLIENTPIRIGAAHSKEKKQENQIPYSSTTPVSNVYICEIPQVKTSQLDAQANNQDIYETPLLKTVKQHERVASQESKTSYDNSELPIDASCSRPKIRKVEAVNYPLLGQRPKDTLVLGESHQLDISYSPKHYVPSCMSSNLSNMMEVGLQEMPQEGFCGDNKAVSSFPSLTNWKNWSPPNSETSFSSSISKIGQNKETPINEHQNVSKERSQPAPQFDFGGFFSMKPSQNPRNIF